MTPLIAFGPLGGQELIVILLIVLVLFGAKKLPELARGLGQSMNEFRKAREDFDREITRPQADLKVEEPKDKQPHSKEA